jgi:uncharacterized protein (DUF4415 family)
MIILWDELTPMKQYPVLKEFVEGRGYSRADWDDADIPELTEADIKNMRPLKEVLPELYAAIQHEKAKVAPKRVSLQLDSDVISKFKATGAGWQSRINTILKEATP